jgi:hypothetical protein
VYANQYIIRHIITMNMVMNMDAIYVGLIALIIVLLSYAYVSSDYYYKKMILQKSFEKLKNGKEIQTTNPEMNWKIINMNIDGYINGKKIVFNQPKCTDSAYFDFTNKNTLAAFLNNVLVIDIDSNEPLIIDDIPMHDRVPKNTVCAKTPHGYHYYFYNDTGSQIPCRVGLKWNNVKYPVDLLTGENQLLFLPPTRIETECYKWINSPFTHRIEPISKHMHLLDLFAYTKDFSIPPEPVNACVSHSIPNMLCIVWDFAIIYQLKYKCTSTSFEQLHSNEHELMYRTNSTYYLFLKHAPLKHYKAHEFVQHVADLIHTHGINGGIVHLGCGISHAYNYGSNDSIVQFNSCRVHNHKKHKLPSAIVRAEQTLVHTNVFTHRPISIISSDIVHESVLNQVANDDNDNDNDTLVNKDMFLIFMISNQTRIPCVCLIQIIAAEKTKDDAKYLKLIQYYMRNVLNATHDSSNSSQMFPFFGEVPMIKDNTI